MQEILKIAVLVSGSGTNLQCLIDAIESKKLNSVSIEFVIADRNCFALERASLKNITTKLLKRNTSLSSKINALLNKKVDLIVMAGFLSILSDEFTLLWDKKIINIHPSLLPKFGGIGMYGENVHKAVLEANETQSGATVHFVTHEIDEGEIIAQKSFPVSTADTVKDLQNKVREIEHQILIEAIQKIQTKFD